MCTMDRIKKIRVTDDNFKAVASRWLDEVESDVNDIDDQQVDENVALESDHVSSTNQEYCSEDEVSTVPNTEPQELSSGSDIEEQNQERTKKNYYGKNRYKWISEGPNTQIRTRNENLIRHLPGLSAHAKQLGNKANPVQVWDLLFTEKILN